MHLSPPSRRTVSAAAGGALVLGSGLSVGILAADMQHRWAGEQVLREAEAVTAAALSPDPEPVIVTVRTERHITPEPVVVHKKVYRTVRGKAPVKAAERRSAPTKPAKKSAGSSTRPRTVVAPAPAPAPAKAPAPAATTSKTS
jgi:hypothetical protein